MDLFKKFDDLKLYIKQFDKVAIAFSGGVDSSFLAKVTYDLLKENTIAFTIDSPLIPDYEIQNAKLIAKEIGINHIVIKENDIDKEIAKNPINRCYYCKKIEFNQILKNAKNLGFYILFEGSNYDDLKDYRPGLNAIRELKIISPLSEAKLTKVEIRELSKFLGLSTWNKPSMACLASRISYNEEIDKEKLKMIEKAELFLKNKGFIQLRVRKHNEIARIEIAKEEIVKIFDLSLISEIVSYFRDLGFKYITLDLEGYNSGSMNKLIQKS